MGQVNVNPPAQPTSDGSGAGFILGIIVAIVIIALLIYFLFLNGGGGTPANNSIAPGPSALLLRFLG